MGKERKYLDCSLEKRSILQRLKIGDKTAFVDLLTYYNDRKFIDQVMYEVEDEDLTKILRYIKECSLLGCHEKSWLINDYAILDCNKFRSRVIYVDEKFLKELSDCFQISLDEEEKIKELLLNEEGTCYRSKREARGNCLGSFINYLGCKKRTTKEISKGIKVVFIYMISCMDEQQIASFIKRYEKFEFMREIFSENLPITLKEEEIALLDAVYRKDENLLRKLLKEKEFNSRCINFVNSLSARPLIYKVLNSSSALIRAAEGGFTKSVVKELIKTRAYLNIRDDIGETLLYKAVNRGDVEEVKVLIKAGADINIQAGAGHTALIEAVINRDKEKLKELIKAGADLNIQDAIGHTALIWATSINNEKAVKELIKAGADINKKNKDGDTALDITRSEIVKKMIQSFDINRSLIAQAEWGNVERVVELVERGADLDILTEFLNKNYCDYEDLVDGNGRTLLMSSLLYKKNSLSLYLIMKGANLNATDNEGNSVLKYILENGDLGLLRVALNDKFKQFSQDKIKKNIIDLNSFDNVKVIKDFVENNPTMENKTMKILVDNGLDENKIMGNDIKSNKRQHKKIQPKELHNENLSRSKITREDM